MLYVTPRVLVLILVVPGDGRIDARKGCHKLPRERRGLRARRRKAKIGRAGERRVIERKTGE